MRRLSIYIDDSAYRLLSDAALRERRRVQDEAALVIERAIEQQPDERCSAASPETVHADAAAA